MMIEKKKSGATTAFSNEKVKGWLEVLSEVLPDFNSEGLRVFAAGSICGIAMTAGESLWIKTHKLSFAALRDTALCTSVASVVISQNQNTDYAIEGYISAHFIELATGLPITLPASIALLAMQDHFIQTYIATALIGLPIAAAAIYGMTSYHLTSGFTTAAFTALGGAAWHVWNSEHEPVVANNSAVGEVPQEPVY